MENGKSWAKSGFTHTAGQVLPHHRRLPAGADGRPGSGACGESEQEAALLAQLPRHEAGHRAHAVVGAGAKTPEERQFTLEVIERLLLPIQPTS